MTHEEARTIMRRIAMDYDRLAKLAEVQLAHQEAIIGRKTRTNCSLRARIAAASDCRTIATHRPFRRRGFFPVAAGIGFGLGWDWGYPYSYYSQATDGWHRRGGLAFDSLSIGGH
jgi:hypothetical protein